MALLTGSQHETWYVAESTYGVTPATPAWSMVCHDSNSVGLKKDKLEIQCLNANRQGRNVRGGAESVSGDVGSPFEYGNFDDWLEAVFMGTWAADVLEVGTTARSFTMQRNFTGLDTPEFHRTTGDVIKSLALSSQANSAVTSTWSFIGQQLDKDNLTTEVAGSTYGAFTDREAFDSFSGTIAFDGGGSTIVTGLDFTIDNQQAPNYVIGSKDILEPSARGVLVTGTVTAFYDSSTTLYDKFLTETPVAIAYTTIDLDGNQYLIEFPNVKLFESSVDVTGEEEVTVTYSMDALYDDVEGTTVRITRTPA